ncbi:LysR substrate-binding domain-containing protein [Ruegeria arenilitoris]|uniref:LysR substrate-binding domain-containing protein n=1 Tax=Ruegeria arenilitoris TaxID=1173585 RepID=UPI0014803BD8|nr:LysR substrate-binding domain-containing protein [Ruegeria arenilitoris]
MPSLPPIYSLRAFEAAARLNSFKKAADELNLTSAAIAHQVKNLEQGLGVEMFRRHSRGVELNEAGKKYLEIAQTLLGDFKRKTQIFKAQYEAQPMRIGALHVVSERLVLPLVRRFLNDFPDVKAELFADLIEPDLQVNNLDIMIWHGETPPEDLVSMRFLSEKLTPVCSPELLLEYPNGMTLDDLLCVPALYDLYWDEDWSYWLTEVGGPELKNSLGFSLYSALIQTAIDGGGVAIGHTGLLGNEISSGRLVKPFAQEIEAPKSYFVLTSEENLNKPNVRTFWDWVKAEKDKAAVQ